MVSVEDVIELISQTRKNIRSIGSEHAVFVGKELLLLGRFLGKVESLVESLHEWTPQCRDGKGCGACDKVKGMDLASPSKSGGLSQGDEEERALLQTLCSTGTNMLLSPGSSTLENPVADLEDIVDAVESVKEALAFVERQGSVERFLLLEENQELLKVAASDLGYSITTFEPLLAYLPDDVSEDYWTIQRQIQELGFYADPDAVNAGGDAVHGLILHFCGDLSHQKAMNLVLRVLQMLLEEAISSKGTTAEMKELLRPVEWMMDNVASLYKAAMMQKASGDFSVYLEYLLMAQGIAVVVWGIFQNCDMSVSIQPCFHGWDEICPSLELLEKLGIPNDLVLLKIEGPLKIDAFLRSTCQIESELAESTSFIRPLLDTLTGSWSQSTALTVSEYISESLITPEEEDDLVSHQRAISYLCLALAIEHQATQDTKPLIDAAIPDRVLSMLEFSPTPSTRAALLLACRTMFRDATCRASVSDPHAGLLIILRFLTSPVAQVRRNAAKALSNYCIKDEEMKILAHRMGATQSLLGLVKRGDILGQEAVAATIANLAANCTTIQQEMGNIGNPFAVLLGLLRSHTEKPRKGSSSVLQNVARAIQNLTGRVNLNRLKAVDAGAVPLLERLLYHDGSEPKSSAAIALCNLTKCTLSEDVEISVPGIIALLDISADLKRIQPMARTGALLACKHAVSRLDRKRELGILSSIELRNEHLEGLIGYLDDPRKDIRSSAARIIGILCQCRTERVTRCFVRKGILPSLISMLDHKETASSAEFALRVMSSNNEEIQSLIQKSMSVSAAASDCAETVETVSNPASTSDTTITRSSSHPPIEACS